VVSSSNPRALYVLHCAGCHGLDGAGPGNREVPDLRRAGGFLRVPGGREYLIKVPGVMNSGLDDRDVAKVANWMLVQIAAGSVVGAYPPYSVAEVARVRARPLPDVFAERRRLLDSARALGIEAY
jgi:mono/diheme cytochrome c family protein